jgi:site-specific recombinase XerD
MSKHCLKSVCRSVCARSIRSLLQRYLDYLSSLGFSHPRRRRCARVVEHFGRWIGRRHSNRPRVREFIDQGLPNCLCWGVSRDRKLNCAALNLLAMIGSGHEHSVYPPGQLGRLLGSYAEHLANTRGLAPDTVRRHLAYTQDMLRRFGIRRETQFKNLTPELIEEDVAQEGHGAPGRGRNVGWCARSFLRYLQQIGLIERDLTVAVPTIARWRLATLPTTLSETEIDRLLAAADLTMALGRRDYAIATCLSELGLRGADVANLQIGDVDFTAGTLQLRQRKERQADVFPLTPRLRAALQSYLQRFRPACASSSVFVRHHAPLGKPLTPVGVCQVVLRLADKAGLRHRVHGSHVLRRSLASRMVNAGATLKQIADFLGHTSIDTTALYAKVDLTTLSQVALPWPAKERKAVRP